jgi:hypothetical protein
MIIPDFQLREIMGFGDVGVMGLNDGASPESVLLPSSTPGTTGVNDLHDPTRCKGATVLIAHSGHVHRKTRHVKAALARQTGPMLPLSCSENALPIPTSTPASLAESDFTEVAKTLGCEVAAIKAVAAVESSGGGFLPDGRPKILFEAAQFGRLTKHVFDKDYPSLSAPNWSTAKKYYLYGSKEYMRLELAYPLNPEAALSAASWGKFQIMGFNHKAAGYQNARSFVGAMYLSERKHLDAFATFLVSQKLVKALIDKEWAKFAAGYNGPKYKENKYDTKLQAAYAKFSPKSAPGAKSG